MAASRQNEYKIKPLPIIGGYGVQRFPQFGPEDSANFYIQGGKNTKRPYGLYPTMGRARVSYNGYTQLIYGQQPRKIFKSIKYFYVIEGTSVFRVDNQYNQILLYDQLNPSGNIQFTYLIVNSIVFACFTDNQYIYIYQEEGMFSKVTDLNAPGNLTMNGVLTKPGFIVSFGNRIAVSVLNSAQYSLSVVNLLNPDGTFDPAHCFSIGYNAVGPVNGSAVFAQESGFIRQMGVLNNTLYIFTDFTTGVWSNYPAIFSGTGQYFPWKKNSTYDWNYGIASSDSLDIDFGYMAFLAQNSDGLLQFMVSKNGSQPEKMSDEAIDVLLQNYTNTYGALNPFISSGVNGFLYQYENEIFYRCSAGPYLDTGLLDDERVGNSIEYKFSTKSWHRCIELNGERCRIQNHIYFNSKHLVTVIDDGTIYEMSGQFYYNEIRNKEQPDNYADDAYLPYPFRYERVTSILSETDYSEFETEYVEIDFVFGKSNLNYSTSPFSSVQFIIDEVPDALGNPQYLVAENLDPDNQPIFIITDGSTNTPDLFDTTYNYLYNPSVSLYWSDDGGISFQSADNREFSQMGVYQWRMRWYQLGCSRNRVYKLVAISGVPIVILGAVMNVRRASGGAN